MRCENVTETKIFCNLLCHIYNKQTILSLILSFSTQKKKNYFMGKSFYYYSIHIIESFLGHKEHNSWIKVWPFENCHSSWCMSWIMRWALSMCHSSMASLWPCEACDLAGRIHCTHIQFKAWQICFLWIFLYLITLEHEWLYSYLWLCIFCLYSHKFYQLKWALKPVATVHKKSHDRPKMGFK